MNLKSRPWVFGLLVTSHAGLILLVQSRLSANQKPLEGTAKLALQLEAELWRLTW